MTIQEHNLKAIADAIRIKENGTTPIPAGELAQRILQLETNRLPENVYRVSLSVNEPEYGTVTSGGPVSAGVTITVTATPAYGYKFTGWQENGEIVSEQTTYTFTVSGDRDLMAMFIVKPTRLPTGYKELTYIQFGTTCKIDTGISVYLQSIRMVVDADFTIDTVDKDDKYVFYSAQKVGTSYNWGSLKKQWFSSMKVGYGKSFSSSLPNHLDGQALIELDGFNKIFKVNDYEVALPFSGSVGRMYIGYTPSSLTYFTCPMQLRSFQFYQDTADNLVADFVPCINPDGVVGMYDLVRKTFYNNNGTGSFVAGPEV